MKILYVTTIGGTMRFFPDLIRQLVAEGHTVDIATNETLSPVPAVYLELGCACYHIDCTRSPIHKGNLRAIGQLRRLVAEQKYDIVHCHTPIAAMCTRLACRKARKKGTRVFYTAHGFHFYTGAPLKNWLLFYPVEKICAHMTDVLITMNQEDYRRAQKKMKAKKIAYVPGVGIDLKRFESIALDPQTKRAELQLPREGTWVLNIGELIPRKNQAMLIRVVAQLEDVCLTIAGAGDLQEELSSLIESLGVSDRVKLLGFRADIAELCACCDVFAFPSFHEGLPVSVMEAMASGKAVACSRIRGNTDLIDDNGGVMFDPHDMLSCKYAMEQILQLDLAQLGGYNAKKIQSFSIETVIDAMKELYGMN